MIDTRVFFGGFQHRSDIEREFDIELDDDIELIFANYGDEIVYDGYAFILYRQGGVLYEVNAWSCSMDDLMYQWKPERVSLGELVHRYEVGEWGFGDEYFSPEARKRLGEVLTTLFTTRA